MPGYLVHLSACYPETLKNRSFELGVLAPDLLKKHVKLYGAEGAERKYLSIRTPDMPGYGALRDRVLQKEQEGATAGLHYGLSSAPGVLNCLENLTNEERETPFYRGYIWHLLTDAICYARLDIDEKFRLALEGKGPQELEIFRKKEVKRLHEDWDKTNRLVMSSYPGIILPCEVEELGVVGYAEGDPYYVDWHVLKKTLDFLRRIDPLHEDMKEVIKEVLGQI